MSDFSIDESIEQIKNPYTKTLFKEVYSSYAMGNYRSTVVMLWSVVVTDLVLKLKELESVYGDATATRILNDIKTEQSKDATSSKWEIKIVEKFFKELGFFETYEVSQMEHLQKMRHASAHPVITNADMLYTPTKALVYSLIQNALEGVLIKEALFSSKVIDFILVDLENIQKTLTTFEDKEKYFIHKFLNKMSAPILIKLIKRLWTFVFLKNDSKMEMNREINFEVLEIILKNKNEIFLDFLKIEKTFISSISIEENLLKKLLEFLFKNRSLLNFFEKEAIDTIHKLVEQTKYEKYALVKFRDMKDYLEYLIKEKSFFMNSNKLNFIKEECDNDLITDEFYEFCIESYIASSSYDQGDTRFEKFIAPYFIFFKLGHFEMLVEKSNENSQTYYRWRAEADHSLIIKRVLELKKDFDFSPFSNFVKGNDSYIRNLELKV